MMKTRLSLLAGCLIAGFACTAHAEIAPYVATELQARPNLLVNDEGWNVPPGTAFNSISANLNDSGQVTFTAGLVPIDGDLSRTGAGIWLGGHGKGHFVAIHESASSDPDATMIISDRPDINLHGWLAYYTSDDGGPYTLRRYNPLTDTSSPVSLLPLTPSSIANPNIGSDRSIGFKGRFGLGYGIALAGVSPDAGILYAVDTNVDAASPYAYIYSPASNDAQQIAVKVSTSDFSHNEIRLFRGMGDSDLVAADRATDAASPFNRFDNGLALNNTGAVAVAVTLVEGNVRAVYRFTPVEGGYEATEIARVDASGPVRAIDSFAPAINDNGLVVFRGSDADGQAVFAGDGESLVRVIGKGDLVDTDLGPGQLGQHDTSPVFSGAPAVNNHGDIAFVSGLHPEGDNQVEWGSGVFVVYAERPEPPEPPADDDTIFANGFEPVPLVLEYAHDDGDGNTNQGPPSSFDPDMLWGNYFTVEPGGEVVTRISVAFGPTFPSREHGPVTFWLLEDADGDGDPRNALAVARVQATPDVSGDTFFHVDIPPTLVHGAFFVGASAKLMGGQDKPARADRDSPGTASWFCYAPDIASVIDDLASAPYCSTNTAPAVPLPSALMVRASAVATP
jgi:hypothetical protein